MTVLAAAAAFAVVGWAAQWLLGRWRRRSVAPGAGRPDPVRIEAGRWLRRLPGGAEPGWRCGRTGTLCVIARGPRGRSRSQFSAARARRGGEAQARRGGEITHPTGSRPERSRSAAGFFFSEIFLQDGRGDRGGFGSPPKGRFHRRLSPSDGRRWRHRNLGFSSGAKQMNHATFFLPGIWAAPVFPQCAPRAPAGTSWWSGPKRCRASCSPPSPRGGRPAGEASGRSIRCAGPSIFARWTSVGTSCKSHRRASRRRSRPSRSA